jgi:uncharacterized membrane protein
VSLYDFLKFIHVLAAAVWVGTAVEQQVVAARAARSGDPARLAAFVDEAEWLGVRVFTPAAITAVVFGVWMVIDSGWNFSDLWIEIGIGLFLISALMGMFFLTPQSGKVKELMATKTMDDPELQTRLRNVTLASRVDLLILIGIVADMVIKPGL